MSGRRRVLPPRPSKPRILWEPPPPHIHMVGLHAHDYAIGTIGECDCGKEFTVVYPFGWIQKGHTRSAGPSA